MSMPATVKFQNHMLRIHEHQGQPWLTADVIAEALGYFENGQGGLSSVPPLDGNDLAKPVRQLYNRHADEFTEDMTTMLRMQTEGGMQSVRVFSHRGCYLITLLARTKKAKAFRAFVLDVLEGLVQPITREPPTMPHSLQHRADAVVSASRTLNALLRSGRALGMKPSVCVPTALEKTLQLTGVDLRSVLDIPVEALKNSEVDTLACMAEESVAQFWVAIEHEKTSLVGRLDYPVRSLNLFELYRSWCFENRKRPVTVPVFVNALKRGFRVEFKKTRWSNGIKIEISSWAILGDDSQWPQNLNSVELFTSFENRFAQQVVNSRKGGVQ